MSWHKEPRRHSLSARGIKNATKNPINRIMQKDKIMVYRGADDWGRKTYKDENGKTWKLVDGKFYSVSKEGEPDSTIKSTIKVKFAPKKELEYKNFTPKQKEGIEKFSKLSSDKMKDWGYYYEGLTGRRASNIDNKGDFYEFVADNELGAKLFQIKKGRFGRSAKNIKEKREEDTLYKSGMKNGWASGKYAIADGDYIEEEDRLNRNSISHIDNKAELKKFFKEGNWTLGQGIIYKDLGFIQQVNGGDEWATYSLKDGNAIQFESMTLEPSIKDGHFDKDISRLLRATQKQRLKLEW